MPFGVEGEEGKVYWTSTAGEVVMATEEGVVEYPTETFEVVMDGDRVARLVPVRVVGF